MFLIVNHHYCQKLLIVLYDFAYYDDILHERLSKEPQ